MSLERRTLVDQIEIRRDGTLQVRLTKAIFEGERVVAAEYHRMALEPGASLEAAAAAVDEALAAAGAAPAAAEEWQRVARIAAVEHTPDSIAAFAARAAAGGPAD